MKFLRIARDRRFLVKYVPPFSNLHEHQQTAGSPMFRTQIQDGLCAHILLCTPSMDKGLDTNDKSLRRQMTQESCQTITHIQMPKRLLCQASS